MNDIVTHSLESFATYIGLSAADIAALSDDESELLLKKMLACQTPNAAAFVCNLLDPDDIDRMHAETRGQVWKYAETHRISQPFYEYIFGHCEISHKIKNNVIFGAFYNSIGKPKNLQTCLRLFHARNLKNGYQETKASIKDPEAFLAQNIHNAMMAFNKEFPNESYKEEIADVWVNHVSFPFFKTRDKVLGEAIPEEEPLVTPVVTTSKVTLVKPDVTPIESQLNPAKLKQQNTMFKRFCTVNDVPLGFSVEKTAKQLILVTTNSLPERIQQSMEESSLLHRKQNFDKIWKNRAQFQYSADSERDYKELAQIATENVDNLTQIINECPECRFYMKSNNGKTPESTSAFIQDYLCDMWRKQKTLGEKWVSIVTTDKF